MRASAGTGKTYQLTNRFIALLAAGELPERILATTFTRKAAGEIEERLFLRLAEAALDEEKAGELSQMIGRPDFSSALSLGLLTSLVRSQHRLSICTLDSFFIRLARSFSIELGLPLGWGIAEERVAEQLSSEAVSAVISSGGHERLSRLVELAAQGGAPRQVHGRLSRAVYHCYRIFLESDAEAWNWLTPPQALSEVDCRAAISALQQPLLPQTKKGAPDKRWAQGWEVALRAFESKDWPAFLASGLVQRIIARESHYNGQPIAEQVRAVFAPLIQHASSHVLTQLSEQNRAVCQLLSDFHREFAAMKFRSGRLRFEDVSFLLAHGAVMGMLDEVYYRLDTRIAHVLLDEFQDTSLDQWRVLQPIADEILSKSGHDYTFFCVGDVKQAIYGWRGGVSEVFDTLKGRYPVLDEQAMELSYRAAQPVVDVVNRVFAGLAGNQVLSAEAETVARWSAGFAEHSTARRDISGYVAAVVLPCEEEGRGRRIVKLRCAAELVRDIVRDAPGASVGILMRTNDMVARLLYELRRRDIRVAASGEGGNPLTDSPAVSLLLSLLTLADHPGNSIAAFHVQCSPLAELLGLRNLAELDEAEKLSLLVRRSLMQRGYGAVLNDWLRKLAHTLTERDLMRLSRLVEMGHRFDQAPSDRVMDFVRTVEISRVEEKSAAQVRVMTIHQAKGLEFDAVVLPELETSIQPSRPHPFLTHRRNAFLPPDKVSAYLKKELSAVSPELLTMLEQERARNVKESLSVLYVAMTRARHALYLMLARPKDKEKAFPLTPAGIIRAALGLDCLPESGVVYQQGSMNWSNGESLAAETADSENTEELPALHLSPKERRRGFSRKSPAELEGGEEAEVCELLRLGSSFAKSRGSCLHAFFEEIEWLDNGFPAPEQLAVRAREYPEVGADGEKLVNEFFSLLAADPVSAMLSRRRYSAFGASELEVFRELPFAVRFREVLLSGRFDRLVVLRRNNRPFAAEVVDFKTDQLPSDSPEALADRVLFYRAQMQAYTNAAARILGLDALSVKATLVFVTLGQIIESS